MWQIKWFKIGLLIFSGLLAVGVTFIIILIHERSFSESPAPSTSETPQPSLQGYLPEPKTLGVATKSESTDPILMYHHIQDAPDNLSLSPAIFKAEAEYLFQENYQTITLSELFNDTSGKKVVLTFDDGYKDVVDNALPVLKEYGFRGVVFVIVDNVGKPGYLSFDDLALLKNEGWEIGSHSLTHLDLVVSSAAAKAEIFDSRKILQDRLGIQVNFFCYPAGKYNDSTLSLVKDAGYLGAVTTESGTKNSKINIFELKRIRIQNAETLFGFKSIFK
ncbi:polysaccharide deacetylase family protein [Patescibacteria group bacterium]|nr:polysaccharide deacetylase family protein [Patescibacteria group bacterium]